MSINTERTEIDGVVARLTNAIAETISSRTGRNGVILRQQIGDMRAGYVRYLSDGTFVTRLLACFAAASKSNVTLDSLANVHRALFNERPVGQISNAIVQTAIMFCLAAESRMITAIVFTSRDEVDKMISAVKLAFDTARDLAADAIDTSSYLSLTYLAGALIAHLSTVARPLPRMIMFTLPAPLPVLALSNRIYYTTDRWEEIVAENGIINPCFCPREIIGLSS